MKKFKILFATLVGLSLLVVGCNGNESSSSSSDTSIISSESSSVFTPKPIDGVPPLFDEGMGYYNIQPSILFDGDDSYIFYTSNRDEGVKDNDVIAVRKINGDEYGEKKVALEPSSSGWDSVKIANADVIKGEFKYSDVTYSYLMAYQGTNKDDKNYSIGLAVSNDPLNKWVKVGTEPLIKFDVKVYGDTWGIGQPSLVSFDNKSKVYLFFTMGEEYSTQTYVRELDLSNLNNIKGNIGFNAVSTKGLIEGSNYTMLNDADFALDTESNYLYVVRNYNPEAGTEPRLPTAVQVARLKMDKLYAVDSTWEIVEERVNMLDLETDETGGWERVYSACIAGNSYGHLTSTDKIKLGLSVTSYDIITKDYTFYQTIIMYEVTNID